jgi:hypothetical protein
MCLNALAISFTVGAIVLYVGGIIRKNITPPLSSWLAGSILSSVTTLSLWLSHALKPPTIIGMGLSWIVLLVCLKYGKREWAKSDTLVILGSAVGAICLIAQPELGLCVSLLVTATSSWPHFRTAFYSPKNHNRQVWRLFLAAAVVSFLAVLPEKKFCHAAQPMTMCIINAAVLTILKLRS